MHAKATANVEAATSGMVRALCWSVVLRRWLRMMVNMMIKRAFVRGAERNAHGWLPFLALTTDSSLGFDRPPDDPKLKIAVKNAAKSNACSQSSGHS